MIVPVKYLTGYVNVSPVTTASLCTSQRSLSHAGDGPGSKVSIGASSVCA